MVNSLRPASVNGPIYRPITVQPEQCIDFCSAAAPVLPLPGCGLLKAQPLPGVFDHFSAPRNYIHREDSETVNLRAAHAKGESCVARINCGDCFAAAGHIRYLARNEEGHRLVASSPFFPDEGLLKSISARSVSHRTSLGV